MTNFDGFYEHEEAKQVGYNEGANGAGGFFIPDSIYRPAQKELPDRAILLYGKIVMLSSKLGYCYAKNKYFADVLDRNQSTISKYISKLKGEKYIEIKYEPTDSGRMRKIYPLKVPGQSAKKNGKLDIETPDDKEDSLPPVEDKKLEKIIDTWNSAPFVRDSDQETKPDKLPRIDNINKSSERYKKLQRRLQQDDFDLEEIVDTMKSQPFLYVESEVLDNYNTWGNATFDWVIKNNENYQRIKEKTYKDYGKIQAYKKYKKSQEEKKKSSPGFDPNIAGGG